MTGAVNGPGHLRREFLARVLPLALGVWTVGVGASYLQHGFLIGGSRGVPLAGPGCEAAIKAKVEAFLRA